MYLCVCKDEVIVSIPVKVTVLNLLYYYYLGFIEEQELN